MKRIRFVGLLSVFILTQALPQGKYQTVGPEGCGSTKNNCHASENKNMVDKHKNSLDFAQSEEAAGYAEKSGVGAANMLKGNSKCMECHGTVVSGRETKEGEEGVSCESCHGAGSGYKDVHSEGPKGAAGSVRDGYSKSLPLGMIDLKKQEILAAACVRCHLLTDQKILSAGHPDGIKFNYKSGMKSVAKHWKYRDQGNIPDQPVFKAAVGKKGPTGKAVRAVVSAGSEAPPAKTRAEKPQRATPDVPSTTSTETLPVAKMTVSNAEDEPAPVRVRKLPPPPRTPTADLSIAPSPTKEPIVLPPFPIITDSTRIDQTLLLLRRRLELLYRKVGS